MSQEILDLVEKQGKAWDAFKSANDAKIADIEKLGQASSDKLAVLDQVNADMNKLSAEITDVLKKQARADIVNAQVDNSGKKLTAEQVEHKSALKSYMRSGNDSGLADLQKKAMNSQTDPDGGYLVDSEMDAGIDRVVSVISAVGRLARNVTIGGMAWDKMMKVSGMAMRRVGDGQTGGESQEPKYSKIQIPVYSAEVEPWVNNETLEDAFIDLEADLAYEAGIAFAEGSAVEFINGDGVGKARGILGYTNVVNAQYAWGKIGYIPSGKAGAFASVAPSDAFITLQHSLKSQYRPGAVWLMNDATLGLARQMKDASGSYYLWTPDALAGFGGRFLGSAVEIDDNMPLIGANAFAVAFGDIERAYTVVNRSGTSLIRDNITTKGITKFNFRRRFGGGVRNFEAIKLMKFATS